MAGVFDTDADEIGFFGFQQLHEVRVRTGAKLRGALLDTLRIPSADTNKFGIRVGVVRARMLSSPLARSDHGDSHGWEIRRVVAVELCRQVIPKADFHHAGRDLRNLFW